MNERLLEKVLGCPKIPSLPAIAIKVIELTSDESVTMAKLAATIQNDQGLASKILKTINSAFYGLSRPCTTLAQAQIMLGLNAVKTLALGFSLVSSVKDASGEDFDYETYWRRGLYSGVASRIIADATKAADPEEAFLGGLMQDIGMIALQAALGPSYARIVNSVSHERLLRAEVEEIEITHPLVGSMLASRWRLPDPMLMCIKHHAQPSTAPPEFARIVQCVAIGNLAAATLMTEEPVRPMRQYLERCEQWFSIPRARAEELLGGIVKGAKEVAKLLELPGGKFPSAQGIIEMANDHLVDLALRNDQEVEQTARRNAQLEQAVLKDEQTGLATLRKFTLELQAQFDRARAEPDNDFSIIMLDIDGLGELNDQLGREAGDAVITGFARRLLQRFEPRRNLIARIGGDEFGILMARVNREEASRLAEDFRKSLAEAPIEMTGCDAAPGALSIKVSVGVTSFDDQTSGVFGRIEQIMHSTDSAMRMARKSGGNCVKVFSPRRKAA